MPVLADIITRVRQDIRDTATPQEFTDAELTRFIERGRDEVSAASPRQRETTLTTNGTDRTLSLTTLTARLSVEAAEYPTGQWPPAYVRFDIWGDTLTMHIDGIPAYALAAFAASGAHKLLTGGAASQRALSAQASDRLRAYNRALRQLRSRLGRHTLYPPAEPAPSQTTDPGP